MSILCKVFGHKPLTNAGYCGGVGYASYRHAPTDGLGVMHLHLEAKCPRCGVLYDICKVHVSKEKVRLHP